MIYHPVGCDVHFGPCPTPADVDALRECLKQLLAVPIRTSTDETGF